jgi:hypothetical protein
LAEVAGGFAYLNGNLILGLRVYDFNVMPFSSGILSLNIESGKISFLEHPPVIESSLRSRVPYDQRFSTFNLDLNIKDNILVVNYPLSDYLIVRNSDLSWSKHEAKSDYFKRLSFLSNPAVSYKGQQEKYLDETRYMPRYTGIVYDDIRNIYYRIGRLPLNKELYLRSRSDKTVKIYEEFSIQVFNKDFEKIGESKFLTKGLLFEQGMFITEEGLYLLLPQQDNEDIMEFKLMELIKLN